LSAYQTSLLAFALATADWARGRAWGIELGASREREYAAESERAGRRLRSARPSAVGARDCWRRPIRERIGRGTSVVCELFVARIPEGRRAGRGGLRLAARG
jgi:hypothetical protein